MSRFCLIPFSTVGKESRKKGLQKKSERGFNNSISVIEENIPHVYYRLSSVKFFGEGRKTRVKFGPSPTSEGWILERLETRRDDPDSGSGILYLIYRRQDEGVVSEEVK